MVRKQATAQSYSWVYIQRMPKRINLCLNQLREPLRPVPQTKTAQPTTQPAGAPVDFDSRLAMAKKNKQGEGSSTSYFSRKMSIHPQSLQASRKGENGLMTTHLNKSLELRRQVKEVLCKEDKQCIDQEFIRTVKLLDHESHSHLRETQCFLSWPEVVKIMQEMRYIRGIDQSGYVGRVWSELQGDTYGGIPAQNLKQLLMVITLPPKKQKHKENCHLRQASKRVAIDGQLRAVFDPNKIGEVYNDYRPLRVNRLLQPPISEFPRPMIKIEEPQNTEEDVEESQDEIKRDRQSITRIIGPLCQQLNAKTQQQQTQTTHCHTQQSESPSSCHHESSESNESKGTALMSVDVNLGGGITEKIVVYEGQTAAGVSQSLVEKYNIDEVMRTKFEAALSHHIKNLLWRIEEVSEELISDRSE